MRLAIPSLPLLRRCQNVYLAAALGIASAAGIAHAQGSAPSSTASSITYPVGGWVRSSSDDEDSKVQYAYPNNLIDRGGQRNRTLIEGHLKNFGHGKRMPLVVINGNPMPLYTDESGRFARPYVFGPGSNGIEMRDSSGKPVKRVQFYEANTGKTKAKIRVILAWDDPQAELDLHIITPNGEHAFFANPFLSTGGGMDVDSVDGAGPEMFSTSTVSSGLYFVYLNYWGNFGAEGYHFDEATRKRDIITARITIVQDENTGSEKRETFVVPIRKIGDLTLVRAFYKNT